MLHQDTRLLDPLELRKQVRFHLCWKQSIKRVVCLNTPRYFLEKHNVDIQRVTTKYQHTYTAFVEAFNKELAKQLFKPMDAQELQDPENVSPIWV